MIQSTLDVPAMEVEVIRVWPAPGNVLSIAYSKVTEGYDGPCFLELDGAAAAPVFPTASEAIIAAGYAINLELGGYGAATVHQAVNGQAVTHNTAHEWVFS